MPVKEARDGWILYEFASDNVKLLHICKRRKELYRKVNPTMSPITKDSDGVVKCYACAEVAPEDMIRVSKLVRVAT